MKQELLEKACIFLLRHGHTVKSLTRSCFDVLSRKDDIIMLIKILEDANSITEECATEMKKVSKYLQGVPLIVAEKAGSLLLDNVVYSRFGVYCLNLATFQNSVTNKMPFVFRDQAGLTAIVRGQRLREIREQEGYSLTSLAKKVGVSKRMIQKYENEKAKVTLARALVMYHLFGDHIFDRINVFSAEHEQIKELLTDIGKKFETLGFNATETRKVPFDLIAKKERELILTEVGDQTNPQLQSLSRLLDAKNLVIYKKKKPKNIPSLKKREFLEFEKSYELIKFLEEF
jgi:putative transcriptional regulator